MEDNKNAISKDLSVNLERIKQTFGVPENFDFIVREFEVKFEDGTASAFLTFYDGLVNKDYINRDIMRSLVTSGSGRKDSGNLNDIVFKTPYITTSILLFSNILIKFCIYSKI